jgi:hypothetical protein
MAHLQCWAGPALRLPRSPATAATAALQFTRAEQSKAAQNEHDRWHARRGSSSATTTRDWPTRTPLKADPQADPRVSEVLLYWQSTGEGWERGARQLFEGANECVLKLWVRCAGRGGELLLWCQ